MSRTASNKISVNNNLNKISIENGDFNFGVYDGDDYGPTSDSNFYNGVVIPVGGYVIYINNNGVITAHAPKDDTECLYYLNRYGADMSNISDALLWASAQAYIRVLSSEFNYSDLPGNGSVGYWDLISGVSGYAPAWTMGTIMFPNTQSDNNVGLYDLSQVLSQGSIYINVYDNSYTDQSALLGSAYQNSGTITFTQGSNYITFGFQNDAFEEGNFGTGVLYWDAGNGAPASVTLISSNNPIFTDGQVQVTITI